MELTDRRFGFPVGERTMTFMYVTVALALVTATVMLLLFQRYKKGLPDVSNG